MSPLISPVLALALLLGLSGCAVVGAGAFGGRDRRPGVTAGAVKTTAKVVTPGY